MRSTVFYWAAQPESIQCWAVLLHAGDQYYAFLWGDLVTVVKCPSEHACVTAYNAIGMREHVRAAVSCCCGSDSCMVDHMSQNSLLQNQSVRGECLQVIAGCLLVVSSLITPTQEGTCCLAAAITKGT